MQDGFEAVESADAPLQLVVKAAEFLDRLVARVERGDERDEGVLGELDFVGVKQGEGDAGRGDDLDERGERLLVLHELHLRADERLGGAGEAGRLAGFKTEGADLFGGAEIFGENIGDAAEFGLDPAGALDELFADVADG